MDKHRPGVVAETLRGGGTGCSGEEYRHEMTKDEAQACTGNPIATNKPTIVFH